MKIEFYGYNDTRALAFYTAIIMLQIFIACLIVSLLTIPFAIVFSIYEILYIFIIPGFFLFLVPISYLINVKYKTFLKGLKVKHKFTLESGYLFKDNKVIKKYDEISIYKFKNFLLLVLAKSYYMVRNADYIEGSREEFLKLCNFNISRRHHVVFDLPNKSNEEIIEFLFNNEINELKGERTFYSEDKKRIISICKNSAGSYSSNRYVIDIVDEDERKYCKLYGSYVPERNSRNSFYETIEDAFNDIKDEIKDYIELK